MFVLLHGAGLGRWIWDEVLPLLYGEAIALDLPGRSDGTNPSDVTLEQCIDLVTETLEAQRLPVALVGHSFSGEIALAAAARTPRKVARVILIASPIPESGKSFLSETPLPQRLILSLMLRTARNGISLPQSLLKKAYCNDLDESKTELVLRNVTREAPRIYLDPVDWSALPEKMPRFFVKLLNDQSVRREDQDRFMKRISATAVQVLPAGHLPMLSNPDGLARVLNGFKERM